MNGSPVSTRQQKLRSDILQFVGHSKGLALTLKEDEAVFIEQKVDGKKIRIQSELLDDVLFRSDTEGKEFIQVNFSSGLKILITENLIGFKPMTPKGLDSTRLPKVVTTPDILSVFEAIQDTLHSMAASTTELNDLTILRKVYEAVLSGGEAVGFDLSTERSWVTRIPAYLTKSVS